MTKTPETNCGKRFIFGTNQLAETRNSSNSLEKEGLDPATETFKVEDGKSTPDPLTQILEKLSAADHHLAKLTAKANQQEEHLAAISTEADQQHAELSAKTDQQHAKTEQHPTALTIKIDQQQADLTALAVQTQQQITEFLKMIPQAIQ